MLQKTIYKYIRNIKSKDNRFYFQWKFKGQEGPKFYYGEGENRTRTEARSAVEKWVDRNTIGGFSRKEKKIYP